MRQRILVDTLGFHKDVLKSEYELAAPQRTLLFSRDPIVDGYFLSSVTSGSSSLNRNVDLCAFFSATSFPIHP
jgi:hypothetical protein